MSNVYPFVSDDERMDQASEWIAKLDRGLNKDEERAFQTWMVSSEKNAELMMELARLWDKMDALNKLSTMFPHEPQQATRSTSAMRNFAMAASFVLVSLLSIGLYQSDVFTISEQPVQQVVSNNVYKTGIGEHATFFLQDNTKVDLNTDSEVRVTYTDKQRLFELVRGELHVTVAHNKQQPLSVHAGDKVIQAVGTAFNVQLSDEQVELLVTDGKVLVAERIGAQAEPLMLEDVNLPSSSLAVVKGEKVDLSEQVADVVTLAEQDIAADLSWQHGNLVFRGESLEQAMREVSRYTAYNFEMSDDAVRQIQIAGLFKTGDVEGLLAALEQNFNVRHQRVGSHTIRLRLAEI